MARTGDKEREGQKTQEGSCRLTSRHPRFNILPLLSTCTLYFACTHAICRSISRLRWTGVLPNAVFFSHLHRFIQFIIGMGQNVAISTMGLLRPLGQTEGANCWFIPHLLCPARSSLYWGSDGDTVASLKDLIVLESVFKSPLQPDVYLVGSTCNESPHYTSHKALGLRPQLLLMYFPSGGIL